jgi:hypothetical protein
MFTPLVSMIGLFAQPATSKAMAQIAILNRMILLPYRTVLGYT